MRENNLMRILIFGIVFILFGCSEDLFDEQINQNNKIIARKISMQDIQFKSNEKLIQSVTNLKQIQLNTASKYEYSEVYDFYIDEENGVYLEKDSLESYTFPVYKTETDSIITNIVFNKNITGEFDVILAEYDILKNEFSDITPEELAQSDVEYTDITGKFRGPELICIETQEYQYTLEYTPEGGYNYVGHWYTTGSYCFWSDTGGGGGSDGIGSGTSSGGNTGGGILTGPVDSPHGGGGGGFDSSESLIDSDCKKITDLKNDDVFKQKMILLKNAAENYSVETLFTVYNDPTPGVAPSQTDAYDYTAFTGTSYAPNAVYAGDTTMQGLIHSHFEGLLSIFSPSDIKDLYGLMLNSSITDDFFIGVVTDEGTSYILQIEDRTKFIAFGNLYLSTETKFYNFERDTWERKYNITPNNSNANNEKGFLKMMSDLNAGISLTSSNFVKNQPHNFSEWKKIVYDNNSGNVIPVTCN